MNKPAGILFWLIITLVLCTVLIPGQPSRKPDVRTFPASQRIREAFCVAHSGQVELEDTDIESLAWALVQVRKMGQTPEGQREADAQAVEALTSEVSDPMWRAAIARAVTIIRNKQEHPRQQR